MKTKTKAALGTLLIISLFILVSYLVRTNQDFIYNSIGDGFIGILAYLLITIVAIVIAPISMTPLIPISSNMWGLFYGTAINVTGWTIGSIIVFFISRRYGVPLIKRFISLEKINQLERKVPKENVFVSLIILRMITPVDVLSYAISLFTKISFRTYIATTIIGITPFAFVFSYLGTVPVLYQLTGFIIFAVVVALIAIFYRKKYKKEYIL